LRRTTNLFQRVLTMLTSAFFERLTRKLVFTLIFLLPIFFLPISLDILELNKQTLLVILTLLAGLSWIGSMIISKSFEFKRGFLNLAPLLLLGSVFVSALLSSGTYLSFLGASSQHYMSVLTIFSLTLLFYIAVNVLSDKKSHRTVHFLSYFFLQRSPQSSGCFPYSACLSYHSILPKNNPLIRLEP